MPPSGPAAVVATSSLAMLAVPQVPRILDARAASAGATRHHTLFKGGEGATPATTARVDHAPRPVDFGGSRASIDHYANCERKQGESSADHDHGYPPNMGRLPIQHLTGPVIPELMMLNKGNLMLRNIFNVIADVVHVAGWAEHHDASLFVLDYDVDQPAAATVSPTQVRAALAGSSIETKRREVAVTLP
jgi:hypothetical protein